MHEVETGREGVFRKLAFFFVWLVIFVIPWENGVVIHGFGTITRVVGIPATAIAILAILESGRLRILAAQHFIMLGFFMWASLTYFWSFDHQATLASISTFLQLFVMVWLVWEFAQTQRELLLLLRAYMLGGLVSSVTALMGFFSNTGLDNGRYTGMNFNAGDLAFILALAIPISLYLAIKERRAILIWLAGLSTVLAFCTIVLTASRGSLIACIPTILVLPVLFSKQRLGRNLLILVFLSLAGIGAWVFMPASSWTRLSTIGSEISSGTLNERRLIWQIGWQVFGQAPFQGIGSEAFAGTVEHSLGRASYTDTEANFGQGHLAAHNTFFSILVEEGAIGFALIAALLLTLMLSTLRLPTIDRALWLCILATWAIGACDLTYEDRKPTWLIFALLISAAAAKLPPRARLFRKEQMLPSKYPSRYGQSPSLPPHGV